MKPDENKRRHIVVCGKGSGGGSASVDWDDILNKPEFATVATSGDYDDLTDKPTIPEAPVQSDWNEADSASLAYIANKPSIPAAQVNADWNAVSGVAQILNKPTIPPQQWFGTQAEYDLIDPKDPNVIYNIEGSDNVQADWNQSDSSADDYIKNKPTIPAAQVNSDWNAVSGVAQILNKPTIPAAQVNSDWNAVSGVAQILNKPTIPVVPAYTTETLTFTLQGGTTQTVQFYVVPAPVLPNYFYVEDISGNDNLVTIFGGSGDIYTSTDRVNWTLMTEASDGLRATIPANTKLYMKASASTMQYNSLGADYSCNVGGNIMSLLNGDNFENTTFDPSTTNNFKNFFAYNGNIVSAGDLVLPSTVTIGCYYGMFSGCQSLTTAPVLPATTLQIECYGEMFYGCSSLDSITTYADTLDSDSTVAWLDGVAATGDFYNLGSATYSTGVSGIPSGWTEHTSL